MHGRSSSAPEVTSIESGGFWIRIGDRELFLDLVDFPWFRNAAEDDVRAVDAPHEGHLRWPRLDVDLTIDSIEHPERYPLKAR